MGIILKSQTELEKMYRSGQVVWEVLSELRAMVKPGVSTMDLEQLAERRSAERGARPAFKGYMGYPCVLCTSINEEVVHGIPSARRKLAEGDIVSLDFGVAVDGYYADAAVTVPVGNVPPEKSKLLEVTRESLDRAIAMARLGNRLSDISHAVESWTASHGFTVVREFVGHGIGTKMHEEPQLPNFGEPGRGPRLVAGMVLAIEPMVNAGTADVEVREDKWTAVTHDRRPSAHFEHTVAVTTNGPWILTRPREMTGPSW
ncbi:MAG TPA: type I methionyl aminopeptidase [Candidatus Acidoferrales bacterium]|nr:type I methionyl aminopeptidase [Candidatus Acidoferrales bacterium]